MQDVAPPVRTLGRRSAKPAIANNVAALVAGAVAATGYPPLHLWPLALAGFAAFAWLVWTARSKRAAFLRGWLFGVAHFTATNGWIATAFTHQSEMPAVLGWFAVPLLSLYLAVYPGLAALAGWWVGRTITPLGSETVRYTAFAFALAASWIVTEWLRSWVFTGYAWGPASLTVLGGWTRPGLALLLPYTGTYALSGLVIAFCAFAAYAFVIRRWFLLAIGGAVLCAAMLVPRPAASEGTLPLTLVQPNLQQEEINDASRFEEQFARIAGLSRPFEPGQQRLVLWPESGVPDYLEPGYPQRYYDQMTALNPETGRGDPDFARARIGSVIGEGSLLLTGVVDLEIDDVDGRERAIGAYNAVRAIDAGGDYRGKYAKAHLVPYGEYLPLRPILEPLGLSRLVAGSIDFLPGPGPRTLDLGAWGRGGIQICYEIVFSGETVDRTDRPDWIFNPSNDGWFGAFGPPQHLAQARMRAIEEGLPVLRATTTGISAVIDANGVVRHAIGMNRADRIDTFVPPPKPVTPFGRFGHWLTGFWVVMLLVAVGITKLVARRRRERLRGRGDIVTTRTET